MEKVSGDFLFRLNSVIGTPVVTYIEFHIDYGFVKKVQEEMPKPVTFEHTAELTEELRADAEQIQDEALRAQFLRAASKYLERKGETVKHESAESN